MLEAQKTGHWSKKPAIQVVAGLGCSEVPDGGSRQAITFPLILPTCSSRPAGVWIHTLQMANTEQTGLCSGRGEDSYVGKNARLNV